MSEKKSSNKQLLDEISKLKKEIANLKKSKIEEFNSIPSHEIELNLNIIFKNSRDAIVVSKNGIHVLVNPAYCKLFGYEEEQLIGLPVINCIASSEHKKILKNINARANRKEVEEIYDTIGLKKDGTKFSIEFQISTFPFRGEEYSYVIVRDITERSIAMDLLKNISKRFSALTGKEYFENISLYLTQKLKLDYAYVGDLSDNKVKVIAGYGKGKKLKPFDYNLKDTPCFDVMKHGICCYSKNVQKFFPKDELLIKMKIDGYLGAPINDKSGNRIGIVVLLKNSPIENEELAKSTLNIFAERITSELIRQNIENQLALSEEKYKALSEASLEAIFISKKGICIGQNKTASILFGYSDDEAIGKEGTEWIAKEDRIKVKNNMMSGFDKPYYVTALKNNGSTFPVEIRGKEAKYLGESVRITALKDISERINAEKIANEYQKSITAIFNSTKDWIWRININTDITFTNKAVKEILGYEIDEILGQKAPYLMHPEDRVSILKEFKKWEKKKVGWNNLIIRWIHKDGSYKYLESNSVPILDDENLLIGYQGVDRDVTYRIETTNQLREKEEKLRTTLNSIGDAVITTNTNTIITSMNPVALSLTQWKLEEAIGKKLDKVFNIIDSKTRKKAQNPAEKVLKTKQIVELANHTALISKDNKEYHIADSGAPILNDDGIITGVVLVFRDISEQYEAREKLKDTADKLNNAQRIGNNGSWVWDFNTGVLECSDNIFRIFGYEPQEIKTTYEFFISTVHPDDIESVERELNESIAQKRMYDVSHRIITKNNLVKHLKVSGIITFEGATPVKMFGTTQDITKIQLAEIELENSRKLFLNTFHDNPAAMQIVEIKSGKRIEVNKSYCNILGYEKEELLFKSIYDDVNIWIDPNEQKKSKKELLKKGKLDKLYIEAQKKSGKFIYLNGSAAIVELDNKQYAILTYIDITEQKKAENELRLLSTAIEQSPASVIITDIKGTIEYVNKKFEQISGYSREEVIGKKPSILKSGDKSETDYKELWETIKSGKKWEGEFQNKKKNGKLYWENSVISPVFDENGKLIRYLAIKEDITEKRKNNLEKIELEKQIRHNQKLETIGTLAGGIAHDFNNILTPIIGYADLGTSVLDPKDKLYRYFHNITIASTRAKDLVEQILLFSKQKEKQKKPLALHLIIKEALKLLRQSIPSTVEIISEIDSYCDMILADSTQLHQVVVNLCTNAWQAMEETGGHLTVKMHQVKLTKKQKKLLLNLKQNEYIHLAIKDTGHGMDKDTLARIYEPFFTTKPVDRGTGLGLPVVHGIVKNHNGEIQVESTLGKGTTFNIYLPVIKNHETVQTEQKREIIEGEESILIVDDDEIVADMTKEILDGLGYSTKVFYNGQDTINELSKYPFKYDLLVSDMTMPKMTGIELAEQVQKLRKGMPIVIMTGFNNKNLVEDTLNKLNIKSIIQKPISRKDISIIVRHALKK